MNRRSLPHRRAHAPGTHRAGRWGILTLLCTALALLSAAPAQAEGVGNPDGEPGFQPITLCHSTGSNTNPWVIITVDTSGQLNGHSHHGDIIPAPAGGCPAPPPPPLDLCPGIEGVQTLAAACPPPPTDLCPGIEGVQTSAAACPPPVEDLCPDISGIQTNAAECPVAVAGAAAEPEATVADQPTRVAGVTASPPTSELPFTGMPMGVLAMLGGVLLSLGFGMHLVGRRART